MDSHWLWAICPAALILGALWRRMLGGWLSMPRLALLLPLGCIMGVLWGLAADAWGYGLAGHALVGLLTGLIVVLHFDLGVQFDNHWLCALRYSLGPAAVGLATGQWWWIAIGPIIAGVYWLGRDQLLKGNNWHIRWPWDTQAQEMTDGYTTFGELAAGGLSVLMFTTAPLIEAFK